jgi:hypothetical protein
LLFCHNCQVVFSFLFLGWESQTLDEERKPVLVAFLRGRRETERDRVVALFQGTWWPIRLVDDELVKARVEVALDRFGDEIVCNVSEENS